MIIFIWVTTWKNVAVAFLVQHDATHNVQEQIVDFPKAQFLENFFVDNIFQQISAVNVDNKSAVSNDFVWHEKRIKTIKQDNFWNSTSTKHSWKIYFSTYILIVRTNFGEKNCNTSAGKKSPFTIHQVIKLANSCCWKQLVTIGLITVWTKTKITFYKKCSNEKKEFQK